MLHLMKNDLKVLFRSPETIFWPFVFPLILGTLFFFSFGQMEEADFETVPVAVVQQDNADKSFTEFLKSMEDDDSKLVEVKVMSENKAKKALEDKSIEGIYEVDDTPSLVVGTTGIEQSILQSLLESYQNGKETITNIAKTHPEGLQAAAKQMANYEELVEQVSLGGKTTNVTAQFFYALIAMACLYGGFIGFDVANRLQANLSAVAARRCVAATSKMKLILSQLLVGFSVHFFNVLVLILYLRYVLHMDFQGEMPRMMIVILIGEITGVSMGIFIGSISRLSEAAKVGINLAVSMGCSFLAGLMNANMKDIVEKSMPIINRINPAALISDAFYCINVYDDPARYMRNIITLAVICMILTVGAFLMIRRERYDSI